MGKGVNEKGEEIVDSTPMELPIGYEYPESLQSLMRRIVPAISQAADREGFDTFEEANDFEIEDEELPPAPWEYSKDQEEEDRIARIKIMEQKERDQKDYDEYKKWRDQPAGRPRAGKKAKPAPTIKAEEEFFEEAEN